MAENQGNSRKKTTHNVCPYAKKCGGCDYQGVEYKEQLKTKQAYMKKLLKPFCFGSLQKKHT